MMKIIVNGDSLQINEPMTIQALLQFLGYGVGQFAVALNQTFVPRSEHESVRVQENDELDIVAPMQGG